LSKELPNFKTINDFFLICLNLIVVLIKVKVNRLSISGRSLQDKWRHRHLNSRDSAFQNGDRFQILIDINGREDMKVCKSKIVVLPDVLYIIILKSENNHLWWYWNQNKVHKVRVMVLKATFNNISAILGRLVLLMEETGVPRENHRSAASHWQTLSHTVVSNTPRYERGSNSQC
jgi:hypothetical protein